MAEVKSYQNAGQTGTLNSIYNQMEEDRGEAFVEDIKQHYPNFEQIMVEPSSRLYRRAKNETDSIEVDLFENMWGDTLEPDNIGSCGFKLDFHFLNILYDHGGEKYGITDEEGEDKYRKIVDFFLTEYYENIQKWEKYFDRAEKEAEETNQRDPPIRTTKMMDAVATLRHRGFMENLNDNYTKNSRTRDTLILLTDLLESNKVIDPASVELHRTAEKKAIEEIDNVPKEFKERVKERYKVIDYLMSKQEKKENREKDSRRRELETDLEKSSAVEDLHHQLGGYASRGPSEDEN